MNFVPKFLRKSIRHRPNLIKIVDNISWLFFDQILRMGVGLFVGVWFARYLGPEQFGLINFSLAFVGLFAAIPGLGLQGIVVRDIVRDIQNAPLTLGTAAFLKMIGGIVAYLLLLVTVGYLRPDDPLGRSTVAILGSILLLDASKIAVFWFESQVQSKYTVLVQSGVFVVFAVIKIILILLHAQFMVFVWVILAETTTTALILISVMSIQGPSITKLRISLNRAKILIEDSWPLALSSLGVAIYVKIDQIMLGQMIGEKVVGIYAAATRISEVWYFVPIAIVTSIFPTILKSRENCKFQYYQRLQKLYNLMAFISIVIASLMTFVAEPIIVVLYGDAYRPAGIVLSIHIWASVPVFLGVASGNWFIAENLQRILLQKTFVGATSNVILNMIFIPKYEAVGAALATLVSYLMADVFYDVTRRDTRGQFYMKFKSLNLTWIFNEITPKKPSI